MKLLKSIILCGVGIAAMTSLTACNDWLDINVDPDTPSAESTPYQQRLANIEFYTNSSHQFAAWRNGMACGDWTRYYNGGTYWNMSNLIPAAGITTTPYQWWFVGAYANVPDMYEKAMAAGNYAYAGVARVIKAYGFMLMTDLYGEMPYTDAVSENNIPVYDTGRTIFMGCIQDLEEGIELLNQAKTQPADLPALSENDSWNNGDIDKWIKLAYLFKARWLNHLIKKQAGSYSEGKYDADAILAALNNAMQSNADNTIIDHTDDNSTTHDHLGWDEPVDYSPLYSVSGMNAGYMITKTLEDNLTNFGGYGVEDPRAAHIIPWAYVAGGSNTTDGLTWSGKWRRSKGVDLTSNINLVNGPIRSTYGANGWYISSTDANRLGDTVYVEATSTSKGYAGKSSLIYRRLTNYDDSQESGTFYTRVSSPTYVGTYAECCFIKAEVLFNKGDKSGAFEAYKAGIQASIELMNTKLNVWVSEDANLSSCPSFTPMTTTEINNFLNNGIGTAGDITLGKIMTQKRIAMLFDMETWNDMRRYNYDPEIFLNYGASAYHAQNAAALRAIPAGQYFRRWRQCSHELNYNATNLQEIGRTSVPGAVITVDADGNESQWNAADDVWTIPVWWDSDQE